MTELQPLVLPRLERSQGALKPLIEALNARIKTELDEVIAAGYQFEVYMRPPEELVLSMIHHDTGRSYSFSFTLFGDITTSEAVSNSFSFLQYDDALTSTIETVLDYFLTSVQPILVQNLTPADKARQLEPPDTVPVRPGDEAWARVLILVQERLKHAGIRLYVQYFPQSKVLLYFKNATQSYVFFLSSSSHLTLLESTRPLSTRGVIWRAAHHLAEVHHHTLGATSEPVPGSNIIDLSAFEMFRNDMAA